MARGAIYSGVQGKHQDLNADPMHCNGQVDICLSKNKRVF